MQSFKLKFLGVTILQGVEFPIFLLIFEWALQQCSATALPVINMLYTLHDSESWTFKASDIDIDKLKAFEVTYGANQLGRSQN